MVDFLRGIQRQFDASDHLSERFANGLEWGRAADVEALPLCVGSGSLVPISYVGNFKDTDVTDFLITVYSVDPDDCLQAEADLRAAFADQHFGLGAESSSSEEVDQLIHVDHVSSSYPYPADERAWRIDVRFRAWVSQI